MTTPESLSLWDRLFNRARREIIEEGTETWGKQHAPYIEGSTQYFSRDFVKYKIVDRLTGSEKIKKEYLN